MSRLARCAALAVFLTVFLSFSHSAVHGTVIPVATLLDADVADGECSLREAIVAANTDTPYKECPGGTGPDRIDIPFVGTIALGADLPQVTGSLEIVGPSAGELTIDGNESFRQFDLAGGAGFVFQLRRVTVRDGYSVDDGGCLTVTGGADQLVLRRVLFAGCVSDGDGGAIDGFAITLTTIESSTFENNRAGGSGGAVRLWNFGAAVIEDSTLSGNEAGALESTAGGGALVASFVDLDLLRSTISGNSAAGTAGGVSFSGFSLARIESSTISGNFSSAGGGSGGGGGLVLGGANVEATFASSVVAGNVDLTVSGGEVHDILISSPGGPPIVNSEGFNFLGNNESAEADFPASPVAGQANVNGDFVGTNAAPIDPLLGALADHGGLTRTREPLPGSPLLDQGNCPGAVRDQRGYFRIETGLRVVDDTNVADFGDGCDIGAVELGATNADGLLHADGFESESLDAWSGAVP
jgi:CSLREA domain-containing protein